MSATSYKIFGNDMSLDVKEDFCSLYGIDKSVEEIHEYIFAYRPDDDDEDACAFWTGLALIEWEYGVLADYVKNKAQYIIKNYSDAKSFLKEQDVKARENELTQLYSKLDTINPNPRKRKNTFVYRTTWKTGDILALPLCGKYVYLHVCAVERHPRKIKELETDDVYVKVFDVVTNLLLDVKCFKPKILHRIKYKNLDSRHQTFVKMLWCDGVREKDELEKKLVNIGNVPTKYETTKSVYADFEFNQLEKTLSKLFELPDFLKI